MTDRGAAVGLPTSLMTPPAASPQEGSNWCAASTDHRAIAGLPTRTTYHLATVGPLVLMAGHCATAGSQTLTVDRVATVGLLALVADRHANEARRLRMGIARARTVERVNKPSRE